MIGAAATFWGTLCISTSNWLSADWVLEQLFLSWPSA